MLVCLTRDTPLQTMLHCLDEKTQCDGSNYDSRGSSLSHTRLFHLKKRHTFDQVL